MKTIAKAYLRNRQCFAQGTVHHILTELKLRIFFPTVYFVNPLSTNPTKWSNNSWRIAGVCLTILRAWHLGLTLILQKKEFKSYFLKKNLSSHQNLAQILSRKEILIVICKDQIYHYAMEIKYFTQFLLCKTLSTLHIW